MPSETPQAELEKVRNWAARQLASGEEQPWSTFLLRRLGETIDALRAGMATSGAETPPRAAASKTSLRLVVSNARAPRNCVSRQSADKARSPLDEPAA
jgi:hypothetical protein